MHLYHHQKHLKTDKKCIYIIYIKFKCILNNTRLLFAALFVCVFIFAAFILLPYDNFHSFCCLFIYQIKFSLSVPMSRQY